MADDSLQEGLRREQVRLLCQLMARAPVVNVIVVAFICFIVWRHVAGWILAAWAAAVLASEFLRLAFARKTLATPPTDPLRALDRLVAIALLVGCARGSAMPLFFADLPPVAHAALSVAFLGFCAGGLSTHGPYARAFYFFAAPMLIALAFAWVRTGTPEGIVLSILFALFALMVAMFARQLEGLVRDSFRIRHERDDLIGQLEREKQQVILARDRAEQANNAKSRFLASASHDLRQPLHALSLFSATLSLRASTPEVREIAASIGNAQSSLSVLVDALLDISKLDASAVRPEIQIVDAGAIAERVVSSFRPAAAAKGIELQVLRGTSPVRTDPMLLQRILTNLLDNAVKYTAQGRITVELRQEAPWLEVSVGDTGEGIPPDEQERIFEEFYQIGNPERDRVKGLGLGLAIVRRVCKLLGSDVALESEPGRGSRFSFRLPLAAEPVAVRSEPAPEDPGEAAALRGRTVLVIDDEPEVRAGMRKLLEAWECRVLACAGLAEANEVLTVQPRNIDVIIADFRLRNRESGLSAVAALRSRLGPVPAIIVSGDTAPERLREAQASGLPLLHKPIAGDDLARVLRGVLAG